MSVCVSIFNVVVVNGYSCQMLWFIVVYIYIQVFAFSIVRPRERLSIEAGLCFLLLCSYNFNKFFVATLFMKCNHL